MRTTTRLLVATLASLTLMALSATSASAITACPATWTMVQPSDAIHVWQFCQKGSMYVVKAEQGWVGQVAEKVGQTDPSQPWGSAAAPNPLYQRKSAATWLSHLDSLGYAPSIVINGTYFDDTSLMGSSSTISYPHWQIWLANAGKTAAADGVNGAHRVCAGWGAVPRVHAWGYANNNWAGVDAYSVNGPANNGQGCMAGGQAQAVVAQEATWKDQTTASQLTYMAFDKTVPAQSKVCFAVAMSSTRANIQSVLSSTFGCSTPVQLDGGNSTQMSYYSLQNHVLTSPVTSPIFRTVPHAFVIY